MARKKKITDSENFLVSMSSYGMTALELKKYLNKISEEQLKIRKFKYLLNLKVIHLDIIAR